MAAIIWYSWFSSKLIFHTPPEGTSFYCLLHYFLINMVSDWMMVCFFTSLSRIISLIVCRRHNCFCLASKAFEQGGIFQMPQLLWYTTSSVHEFYIIIRPSSEYFIDMETEKVCIKVFVHRLWRLYRKVFPTVTQDHGFYGLIWCSAPLSRLLHRSLVKSRHFLLTLWPIIDWTIRRSALKYSFFFRNKEL